MDILKAYDQPQHQLAKLALQGTWLGDAFGQRFFDTRPHIEQWLHTHTLPPAPWYFTDDTIMTIGLTQNLFKNQSIDQDTLAQIWAINYQKNISRGYGGTAHKILREIGEGKPWINASKEVFSGMGSMGNGAAMRVAPIGAFYTQDLAQIIHQARLSAQITHSHPEAQAGAIAVAIAAHLAGYTVLTGNDFLAKVRQHTPDSQTKDRIDKALRLPSNYRIDTIVHALGNGHKMLAQDTVPLTLWCAAHHLDNFEEALWLTVSALGDRDTTCAIVGGIVALRVGTSGLPARWISAAEPILEEWLVK
ncbi:ADP-ribosylglycohydrolase family protein [uncultured Microscilla sp.]|uniref:ADP-ribosylglycohydrolase family protein n=1 Tax=uncultured Microscilla sp. TaxID=432653 RepID=UPI0026171E5D|nr:ADP-ribosylglycohydrolase family protein [uncultured Microscilla sp.]